MPRDPHKGHIALRRGRISAPSAEYFLTICTTGRRAGLTIPEVAEKLLAEARVMEADATWQIRCGVLMPDHLHLLVVLGDRLSLAKSISRLKAKASASLQTVGLNWERGFYDHQLRANEDYLGVFLYIFLNPYRGRLCARSDCWPWFYCRPEDWEWFKGYLDVDRPPPAWLKD